MKQITGFVWYVGAGGQQMLNHLDCAETIYWVKNALEILISRDFLSKSRTERRNFSLYSKSGTKMKFQEMKLDYLHCKCKHIKIDDHQKKGSNSTVEICWVSDVVHAASTNLVRQSLEENNLRRRSTWKTLVLTGMLKQPQMVMTS